MTISKPNTDEFLRTAKALKTIRDKRLYRSTHSSFSAYCKDKWKLRWSDVCDFMEIADSMEATVPQ